MNVFARRLGGRASATTGSLGGGILQAGFHSQLFVAHSDRCLLLPGRNVNGTQLAGHFLRVARDGSLNGHVATLVGRFQNVMESRWSGSTIVWRIHTATWGLGSKVLGSIVAETGVGPWEFARQATATGFRADFGQLLGLARKVVTHRRHDNGKSVYIVKVSLTGACVPGLGCHVVGLIHKITAGLRTTSILGPLRRRHHGLGSYYRRTCHRLVGGRKVGRQGSTLAHVSARL